MKMNFELEPHHRNIPNEEFIADLQRVAKDLGVTSARRARNYSSKIGGN
jgi:hypothetical protein